MSRAGGATATPATAAAAAAAAANLTGATNLEQIILELAQSKMEGISQKDLEEAFEKRSMTVELLEIATAVNRLTQSGQLSLFRRNGVVVWKYVEEEKVTKLQGLDIQERIVYSIIEREKNKGIWIKEIRKQSNIFGQGVLEKILKSLLTRKLIKAEKSVANKKVYMLYELKPAEEVTGGTWYKGHDMDTEFIEAIRKTMLYALKQRGPMTSEQLGTYVNKLKISVIEIPLRDTETVLQTLVMDRLVEVVPATRIVDKEFREQYDQREQGRIRRLEERARGTSNSRSSSGDSENKTEEYEEESEEDEDDDMPEKVYGLAPEGSYEITTAMVLPCTGCSLINQCHPGHLIEPATCSYLREWLAMKPQQ